MTEVIEAEHNDFLEAALRITLTPQAFAFLDSLRLSPYPGNDGTFVGALNKLPQGVVDLSNGAASA